MGSLAPGDPTCAAPVQPGRSLMESASGVPHDRKVFATNQPHDRGVAYPQQATIESWQLQHRSVHLEAAGSLLMARLLQRPTPQRRGLAPTPSY